MIEQLISMLKKRLSNFESEYKETGSISLWGRIQECKSQLKIINDLSRRYQ